MVEISCPLWFAIIIVVAFVILTAYLIFSDLIARLLYKHLEKKYKKEESEDENKKD